MPLGRFDNSRFRVFASAVLFARSPDHEETPAAEPEAAVVLVVG